MCGFAKSCAHAQRCERNARCRSNQPGPAPLTRNSFRDLLSGHFAVLQEFDFLSQAECDQIEEEHERILALTPELHESYPFAADVTFTAPALHAHADDPETYFRLASMARDVRREHAPTWERAAAKVIERLAALNDGDVKVAIQPDRGEEFFAGLLRAINHGAYAHTDYVGLDLDGDYAVRAVTRQFGINVFVSHTSGGDCVSFDRASMPGDEAYRIPTSAYGIDERLFEGVPKVTTSPTRGSIAIIATQRYHLIRPITAGERVTLSFFCGPLPNGDLVVWA